MSFAYRVYRKGLCAAVGAGYESQQEAQDVAAELLREPGEYAEITENTKIIGRIEYENITHHNAPNTQRV